MSYIFRLRLLLLFTVLCIIVSIHPALTSAESNYIAVTNAQDLVNAIGPDRTIELFPGTYNLSEIEQNDSDYYNWENVYDGAQLVIHDIKNLTLKSKNDLEARLLVKPRYAYVLSFKNTDNINISGIVSGHTQEGYCVGGVFEFNNSRNIKISDAVLYGCGTEGLTLSNVTGLNFTGSVIKQCTYSIMTIKDSEDLSFTDSSFFKNGIFDLINITNSKKVVFDGCTIRDNIAEDSKLFLVKSSDVLLKNSEVRNNQTGYFIAGDKVVLENTKVSGNTFSNDPSYTQDTTENPAEDSASGADDELLEDFYDEGEEGYDTSGEYDNYSEYDTTDQSEEYESESGDSYPDLEYLSHPFYERIALMITFPILIIVAIVLSLIILIAKIRKRKVYKENPELKKHKFKTGLGKYLTLVLVSILITGVYLLHMILSWAPALDYMIIYDRIILLSVLGLLIVPAIIWGLWGIFKKQRIEQGEETQEIITKPVKGKSVKYIILPTVMLVLMAGIYFMHLYWLSKISYHTFNNIILILLSVIAVLILLAIILAIRTLLLKKKSSKKDELAPEPEKQAHKKGIIIYFILVVLILAISGGVYFTLYNLNNQKTTAEGFSRDIKGINKIIDYSKKQILELFGDDYTVGYPDNTGEAGDFQSYYYRKIGLSFVFNYTSEYDDNPGENMINFIDCDSNISIKGAKAGMNFKQLQKKLGKSKILEYKNENLPTQYYLKYEIGKCRITFSSYKKDGKDSFLSIQRIGF